MRVKETLNGRKRVHFCVFMRILSKKAHFSAYFYPHYIIMVKGLLKVGRCLGNKILKLTHATHLQSLTVSCSIIFPSVLLSISSVNSLLIFFITNLQQISRPYSQYAVYLYKKNWCSSTVAALV